MIRTNDSLPARAWLEAVLPAAVAAVAGLLLIASLGPAVETPSAAAITADKEIRVRPKPDGKLEPCGPGHDTAGTMSVIYPFEGHPAVFCACDGHEWHQYAPVPKPGNRDPAGLCRAGIE